MHVWTRTVSVIGGFLWIVGSCASLQAATTHSAGLTPGFDALVELRRAFNQPNSSAGVLVDALVDVEDIDTPKAAEALIEVYDRLQSRILPLQEKLRLAYQSGRRGGDRAREIRSELEPFSQVVQKILAMVRELQRTATVDWLLYECVANNRAPYKVRGAAAISVGRRGISTRKDAELLVDTISSLESAAVSVEAERALVGRKGESRSIASLRSNLDPIRELQDRLQYLLGNCKDPATVRWLFEYCAGNDKLPLSVRVYVLKQLAGTSVLPPESFVEALLRARKPGVLTALLNAVARTGPKAKAAADRTVKLLRHSDATVREAAAWTLASLAVPQAIEPLLAALESESGRTQRRMAAALEVITRQKLGLSVTAWRQWFADNGAVFTSGAVPLGGGETTLGPDSKGGYYFGIPQEGHSIVYVIDVSGSMREPVNLTTRYERRRRRDAGPGEKSRIQACKEELIKALAALPEGTEFNIIHYAYVASRYSKKMIKANPARIEAAQRWVQSLTADGATNIYDALESAFGLAGRGTKDKYYDATVETVFLLTDGRPQLPNGIDDSTERIRAGVQRWNPYGKVVVHTIGMGKDVNVEFLEALAKENGGRYVQR